MPNERLLLTSSDAPETAKINYRTDQVNKPGQPQGEESWEALENKTMGKEVKLDILDIDKHRRMVGIIWLGDRNINLEMVSEGHTEAFVEYLKPPYRSEFVHAEKDARSSKKGIWSLTDYERP